MRRLFPLLIITLFAPPSVADEDHCAVLGQLAKNVMHGRQLGVPISRMMQLVKTFDEKDENVATILRTLILTAYETPRFQVEANRKTAVEDFQNKVMLVCYQRNG